MTGKLNNKRLKFLTNNWVVTLTATLVGVFAALYLNELVSSNKLSDQKAIATENILAEISSNSEKIQEVYDKHTILLDMFTLLENYYDDESEEFIAPADSIARFKSKHPNLFVVEDSTMVRKGVYRYNGEMNLDFTLPQFEITSIAWKTLKDSGVSQTFEFGCLMYLERLFNLTDEISDRNNVLFDYFYARERTGKNEEAMLKHLKFLIGLENSLIELSDEKQKELENCGK